jgi:transcriptional regulator with XRE-family HTH domain
MKERLLEFLKNENKSSAQLAEEIGVQPSGISHILSGRNNPSLDFVMKMLEKYKFLSVDWLLFGKGSMYKEIRMQGLFDSDSDIKNENNIKNAGNETVRSEPELHGINEDQRNSDASAHSGTRISDVEKIVWFYKDNSFEEYYPKR